MMAADIVPHKLANLLMRNRSAGTSKTLHKSDCLLSLPVVGVGLSEREEISDPTGRPLKLCNAADQNGVFETFQLSRLVRETAPDNELVDSVDGGEASLSAVCDAKSEINAGAKERNAEKNEGNSVAHSQETLEDG